MKEITSGILICALRLTGLLFGVGLLLQMLQAFAR
jgi:hypothetical protein